jgi:hypothetical protein
MPATLAGSDRKRAARRHPEGQEPIMQNTPSSTRSGSLPVQADRDAARGRFIRAIEYAAAVASASVAGLGVVWLLVPDLNPFANAEMRSLASMALGPVAVAAGAVVLGGAGVALAALLLLGGRAARAATAGVGGAALALTMAAALGSMGIVAFTGYLFGLGAVVAGVATIAVMLVRTPRLGLLLLAGLIAVIATAAWLAGLTIGGVTEFATAFSRALATEAPNLGVAAIVVIATLVWAVIGITGLRNGPADAPFEAWLVRHRRSLTILAALGPVPYAVARSSWLTPWPLFGPAASTLTLGLILPWGRRFPRWMPRIGGRSVPVATAVVPGSIAAAVLCISAAPMLATVVGNPAAPVDALLVNLVLPLWFWGPMLALAVWAYAAWRRDEADRA